MVTALATLVIDQLSKALVRVYLPMGDSLSLGGFLELRQVRNPGTAFGIIQVKSWPLFLVSIFVFALLLLVLWRWGGPGGFTFQLGLGLIIGGAIGNIVDRIALGEVVDFIDFRIWPIFNVADIAIVVGIVLTMIIVVKESWKKPAEGA